MDKSKGELQRIAAERVLATINEANFKELHVVIPPEYSQKLRPYVHMEEDFKTFIQLLQSYCSW